MTGEIWAHDPRHVIAVRTDSVPPFAWAALCDVAAPDGTHPDSISSITLPFTSADLWLQVVAQPDVYCDWNWDRAAVDALTRYQANERALSDLVQQPIGTQSQWPDTIPAPEQLGIVRPLTSFQLRDIARLLSVQGGCCFSVPGSGKTTCALTVFAGLRHLGVVQRMLVLAPLSAHEAWRTEPDDVFSDATRPTVAVKPAAINTDIAVFNYEALEADRTLNEVKLWCQAAPTLVVFDEAHRVKRGALGVRGRAALTVSRVAARRLVLTGTPRPNSISDLENVFEFAYPGRGVQIAHGQGIPTRHAFVRTTKSELGLPELRTRTEHIPMSPAHDQVYGAILDAAHAAVDANPALLNDMVRVSRIVMLMLQTTTDPSAVLGHRGPLTVVDDLPGLDLETLISSLPSSFTPTKLVRAAQLVSERAAAGEKTLVWACFKSHVDRLRVMLDHHHPAVITGDLDVDNPAAPTDRTRQLDQFRNDPACHVLIATPHTLAEGVSLHHTTTHQVHVDRPYNAALFLQSLDRTHRLGLPADAQCTVTYLCSTRTAGDTTIDHTVADALDRKVAAMSQVLNDPDLEDLAIPEIDEHRDLADLLFDGGANEILRGALT